MSAAHLERSPDLVYSAQDGFVIISSITDAARAFVKSRTFDAAVGIRIVGQAEESGLMVQSVEPEQLEQTVRSLLAEQPVCPDPPAASAQPEQPKELLQSVLRYARDNPDHR